MTQRFVGLMSGTSLDGADAVVAAFSEDSRIPIVLGAAHASFDDALRETFLALQVSSDDELHRAALAANRLADVYADVVARALADASTDAKDVRAIGAHGLTVRHRPELGFTLQINAPARLAEATGIAVVADFRSRDVAAGGQGAPLLPAFHAVAFRHPSRHRLVVNVGGMSNVTDLPSDERIAVRGWDCGPGNVLLDGWIRRHRGLPYDAAGQWAASGRVNDALLARMLEEPWFALGPPKSTGRDLFGEAWLAARLDGFATVPAGDVQATLATLTATTIAESVQRHAATIDDAIVCGGGAYNRDLLARLAHAFGAATSVMLCSSDAAGGLMPEHIEALGFAWLAKRRLDDEPGNLPSVTGAAGPRILGAIHAR